MFLLIPSTQLSRDSLIDKDEVLPFSDFNTLVLGSIGQGCSYTSLNDLVPPSCLHEIDFNISYDMMDVLTHVIFVFEWSLSWFLMKHIGRDYEVLL